MIRQIACVTGLLGALSGCTSLGGMPTTRMATAALTNAGGLTIGTAWLTAAGEKVTLNIALSGQAKGPHGIHLHMVGKCDSPAFTTAGGHLNPSAHQHGSANPLGSHLGDLPNVTVANNGSAALSAALAGTRAELETQLFDSDGTAIVLHADPDDYKTDPSGNSGARIACGVLRRAT